MDGRAKPRCKPKSCRQCKQVFTPRSNGQWYCSNECVFHSNYSAEESGCWRWARCGDKDGYGIIHLQGGTVERAHRFAYRITHGEIPDGLVVRHSCDNPRCVNPAHLSVGTCAENTGDAVAKNRHYHGERFHTAKLTEADVIAIRAAKATITELAKAYGVDKTNISCIRRGKTWRHLLREQTAA